MTPVSMIPALQRSYFGGGPFVRFAKLRERADELISEVVEERRADPGDRDDVLTMLLEARHEDGSPMSYEELRDELMTLLTAGHETTASELTWAFAILAREPRVQDELIAEIDAGDGEEYLTATVHEILRRRPVLPNAEPRLVKQEVTIGGWTFPPDVSLIANAYLLHHDPDVYPDPYAFRPERFVGEQARHLHLDPVRRRPPPLHRRRLRDARDEGRIARRLRALPDRPGRGRPRAHPPPRDHRQPEARRPHDLQRPYRPAT